jgi:hypothetical protein
MPRSNNSSTMAHATSSASERKSPNTIRRSFSYEYDYPTGALASADSFSAERSRRCSDELTHILDKALAYAG